MIKELVIHGGGYTGLTGALHFALAGTKVLIYDPDQATVDGINKGFPRANEYLSYLNPDIASLVERCLLKATTNLNITNSYKIHVVNVPTERNGQPYDEIIYKVLSNLITKRKMIIVESTVPPGLIDDILNDHPKFKAGKDFNLAICPRRDWFSDRDKNLYNLPRINGGVTQECTLKATEVLSTVSQRILETDYHTAELVKAFENAQLHIQCMLAYQMAYSYPDRNVAEMLKLAGTHWRLPELHLGLGTGGRCVPLGTQYLTEAADEGKPLTLGKAASDWDREFRILAADSVAERIPIDGNVLVLGIAYRPEFKDAGLSPGLDVAKRLLVKGIDVSVNDPMWSDEELEKLTQLSVGQLSKDTTAIILATPHKVYEKLPLRPNLWIKGQVILDGFGLWAQYKDLFEQKGVRYYQVGTPGWLED